MSDIRISYPLRVEARPAQEPGFHLVDQRGRAHASANTQGLAERIARLLNAVGGVTMADLPIAELWVAGVIIFGWWCCRDPKPTR